MVLKSVIFLWSMFSQKIQGTKGKIIEEKELDIQYTNGNGKNGKIAEETKTKGIEEEKSKRRLSEDYSYQETKRKRIKEESTSDSVSEESISDSVSSEESNSAPVTQEQANQNFLFEMGTTLNSLQQQLFNIVLLDYRAGDLDEQFKYDRDYSTANFWGRLTHEFNKRALERKIGTLTELEFHSYGTMLERKFLRQKKKGKLFIDPELSELFSPCSGCQERIPVFINNALDSIKPKRFRSRSRSQSRPRSQSGAQNLTPIGSGASIGNARSRSLEFQNPNDELIEKLFLLAVEGDFQMCEVLMLVDMINEGEANSALISFLRTAKDHSKLQFANASRALLERLRKKEQEAAMLKKQ